jgi:hypothetical protein
MRYVGSEVLMHEVSRGGTSVTPAEHLFSSLVLFFSHDFFNLGTHTSVSRAELFVCNFLSMIHHLLVENTHTS